MIHVHATIMTRRIHLIGRACIDMHVSPAIELQTYYSFYLTLPTSTSRFLRFYFSLCPVVWIGMDTRLFA